MKSFAATHRTSPLGRFATLTGLTTSVLLLGACGLSGGASDPVDDADGTPAAASSISVWFPGANQAEIDLVNGVIVPAFEAENGVEVEVTFVDWGDLSPKLNAAFAAGTAPDVFGHGPAAVADFVANDRVEDLAPYLEGLDPAVLADVSAALPGGQVDGTQYLVPLSVQGYLVAYDADAFVAAGLDPDDPPQTWEELRVAAEALTVRDGGTVQRAGILLPTNAIGAEQSFANLLVGAGGSLVDDGAAAFDSPEGLEALEYFAGLYTGDEPVASMLAEDYVNLPPAQSPLVTGGAAMAMLTAPTMRQAFEAAPDKDLRVMAPLRFEDSEEPAMFGGAGPGLMINSDSAAKDAAWDFISYLLEPEVAAQYTEGIGAVPVHASATSSEYVAGDAVIKSFVAATPSLIPNPNVVGWVGMRDQIDANVSEALFGRVSPADALATAAAEVDAALQEQEG
ncbi:extracellular solute-binding protein [Pengzhenrongella sicca]|uniref:Extracellular solute-binding protein n=1 Tax=Pengzhenrongella sicca TaxID=2819238 RepID=A0A8A4ZHT8_9MICO|nr:extracellular solute-binding protein [Pengzhenrongella sicca]QTE29188.1 extracellular solute-binding protein [Pengzhenrongella sicca]